MWLTPRIYSDLECFFSTCTNCMCMCACVCDEVRETINGKSINLYTHMGKKSSAQNHQIEPIQLQHINTLAANPYLPICNLYACRCIRSLSELRWNADSTEIWILIWLRVRVEGLSAGANINSGGWAGKLLRWRWGGGEGEGAKCDGKGGVTCGPGSNWE